MYEVQIFQELLVNFWEVLHLLDAHWLLFPKVGMTN